MRESYRLQIEVFSPLVSTQNQMLVFAVIYIGKWEDCSYQTVYDAIKKILNDLQKIGVEP